MITVNHFFDIQNQRVLGLSLLSYFRGSTTLISVYQICSHSQKLTTLAHTSGKRLQSVYLKF